LQDVKYQCTVVELLIEKHDSFFQTSDEIRHLNQTIQKNSFSLSNRTTSRFVFDEFLYLEFTCFDVLHKINTRISLYVHFDKSELSLSNSGKSERSSTWGAQVSRLPNVLETFEALKMDSSSDEERILAPLPESDFTDDFSESEDAELQL
jgi:hypothetical protein